MSDLAPMVKRIKGEFLVYGDEISVFKPEHDGRAIAGYDGYNVEFNDKKYAVPSHGILMRGIEFNYNGQNFLSDGITSMEVICNATGVDG